MDTFQATRILDGVDAWRVVLTDRTDAEEQWFADTPVEDLTKIALARRIQIRDGLDDGRRAALWKQTRDILLADLFPPAAAPGPGIGRARGRGVVAAVGRGGRRGGRGHVGAVVPAAPAAAGARGRGKGKGRAAPAAAAARARGRGRGKGRKG